MSEQRTAVLVGNGITLVVSIERAEEMKDVAKSLGLRRLMPMSPGRGDAQKVMLQCQQCRLTGLPHDMLVDVDGEPFNSYVHRRCVEGLK